MKSTVQRKLEQLRRAQLSLMVDLQTISYRLGDINQELHRIELDFFNNEIHEKQTEEE